MKDANVAAVIALLGFIAFGILEGMRKDGIFYALSFTPGIAAYVWLRAGARRRAQ